MTFPPPPSEWSDPARSSQPSSAPPVDPLRMPSDPSVPAQPLGTDPSIAGYSGSADPYAVPAQPVAADPYGAPQGGYPAGYAVPGYPVPGQAPAYGYPPPPVQTNSLALVALILSVLGVSTCITAPIGAILGHVARGQIRERGEDGDGMAKAAIIVGWVITGLVLMGILAYILIIVFAISQSSY